jgi:SAM-dependent methyltransferase
VTGLRESDLAADRTVLKKDFSNHSSPKSMLNHLRMDLQGYFERPSGSGHVAIYNQDLADLKDIPNNSIDIVASVSALEHNSPENLSKVVKELIRILKPGGSILATLTASHSTDSWHAPSAGWCYTAETIRQLFGLPEDIPDNYRFYDQIMTGIRNHAELRDNLARFYFESGQNGMPWGIWDPQYLPVGVWKVKKYA